MKKTATTSTTSFNRHVDKCKINHGLSKQTQLQFQSEKSSERVKEVIDKKTIDPNHYIREMAQEMKEKFDKYWGESNMVMSIGAVMDPRFKMKLPTYCFPILYPKEGESDRNLACLLYILNDLYQEYCAEEKDNLANVFNESSHVSSSETYITIEHSETPQGINDYDNFIRESGAVLEPIKSELDEYLTEKIVIPSSKSFDVLAWWRGNCSKYPVLSNMARDVLSIPISTVASESTFSAGGRVIEPHCSCLKPETVEMLLCGADWAREIYGLKKSHEKDNLEEKEIVIDLTHSQPSTLLYIA